MDTENSLDSSPDMDLKVRRRVAKKVLMDIQGQVDEIEHEVENEKKASLLLLPGLILVVFFLVLLWLKPDFFRSLSALF